MYARLFGGELFPGGVTELNQSALVVEDEVLLGASLPLEEQLEKKSSDAAALLRRLALMPDKEITSRRKALAKLAPAMQYGLSDSAEEDDTQDAWSLAMQATQRCADICAAGS